MTTVQDLYPWVELAPPPRARPLAEPQVISPTPQEWDDDDSLSRAPSFLPDPGRPGTRNGSMASIGAKSMGGKSVGSESVRGQRESYLLTGTRYLVTNTGKTMKLPIPSDSPADPLNWSSWKTAGAWFALTFYSILSLTASQAAAVMMDGIQNEFYQEDIPEWLTKALVTGPTLFMGLGCFFWVPLSIGMGRRPALLIATVEMLLALAWAADARSFESLVGATCFLGFGEGLALSLVFLMIVDMTYINRRTEGIALMWCFAGALGTSGVALVPIITNYGHNWRRFYQWWTIPFILSLLITFWLYPETYFKRPTVAFDGLIVLQSATEKLTIYQDEEAGSEIYRDLPEYPLRRGFAGFRDRLGLSRSPFASWTSMGRCYLQMGYCAANPLIFWVFVASAGNSATMIYIGATYATVLTAPPYNMSHDVVGTVNVASGVGALIGFLVWCFLIAKVVTRLSNCNQGVHEAEHYLVGYILPIITGALSAPLYGLTVQFGWHPAWIYIAYCMNGLSFVTLMIANTLWVAEAFPRWAAPALSVVGGGCYLLTFGISFALGPWIEAHGFKWVGIELMIFQILGGFVAMPVAFWGKSMRQAIQGRWADDRSGALRPV